MRVAVKKQASEPQQAKPEGKKITKAEAISAIVDEMDDAEYVEFAANLLRDGFDGAKRK